MKIPDQCASMEQSVIEKILFILKNIDMQVKCKKLKKPKKSKFIAKLSGGVWKSRNPETE